MDIHSLLLIFSWVQRLDTGVKFDDNKYHDQLSKHSPLYVYQPQEVGLGESESLQLSSQPTFWVLADRGRHERRDQSSVAKANTNTESEK